VQFDDLDPAYTRSLKARGRFRLAATIAAGFVVLLWLIYLAMSELDLEPEMSGIRPRQWVGLPGILFAPLVHGGFEHLFANSLPLLVVITAALFLYPNAMPKVLPAVWVGPGIAVWLLGRDSVHFGASGLVYGLAAYVFVAGVLRRDRRAVAASLVVWFMYGSLVWGVLPVPGGVSWETHLAAAVIGVAWAVALRHLDLPPRRRYDWDADREDNDATRGYE
jgi:membrane associated rhomboid family serine protease